MSVKPIPDGYHTITPYLVSKRVDAFIGFLKKAFDAREIGRTENSSGRVMNAEIKIGDSMVMIGEAIEESQAVQTTLYLYVDDTDTLYNKAISAGGISLMEPANQFYGDRNAGIQDPSGNKWWIATHIEDVPADELERRAKEK